MAYRPVGYGLTAELARKNAEKFDLDIANDVLDWIRDVFEYRRDKGNINLLPPGEVETDEELQNILKDGILLCKLVNVIKPDSIRIIHESSTAFKQIENIGNFLKACTDMGVRKCDLFQTVDLYETNNMMLVLNGICAFGRKASSFYSGPGLGPEEAIENKRNFTDLTLRTGEGLICLQAGLNRGGSQLGINFGKTREIAA